MRHIICQGSLINPIKIFSPQRTDFSYQIISVEFSFINEEKLLLFITLSDLYKVYKVTFTKPYESITEQFGTTRITEVYSGSSKIDTPKLDTFYENFV